MKASKENISQHWQSFQQGDEHGLRFFLERHYPSLCFFANRFLKDPLAAEDIVSESIIKIWEKRTTISTPLALKNYAYTTVRNACLRWLENQHRLQLLQQQLPLKIYTEETALHHIIRTETIEELHTAIQHLPPKSSEVFTKLFVEGKSVAETAKEMEIAISTVKSHKKTGLALLRNMVIRVFFMFLLF